MPPEVCSLTIRRWIGIALMLPAVGSGATIQTIDFDSPAVGRSQRYQIVLPDNYRTDAAPYSVLYLLHGVNESYLDWSRSLEAVRWTDRYPGLLIVLPDAGNSWYINWPESERDRWEDFIIEDLIAEVDGRFHTQATRDGRALGGFSMGGYGALMLGLRHPEKFASIGSSSGYLGYARQAAENLRHPPEVIGRRSRPSALGDAARARRHQADLEIGVEGFDSLAERTPIGRPFVDAEEAEGHDPYWLLPRVPRDQLPHISLDCGREDPLYGFTAEFVQLLLQEKVPFTYQQMAGGHDRSYRTRALSYLMANHYDRIQRPLPAPPEDGRISTPTDTVPAPARTQGDLR
ncbi:MAG: hypothetical protein K8J08_15700 [Thermoanaerobaculia bacterium]|nr:hypothetical protein [Thermoanaerobaculia bacterium]